MLITIRELEQNPLDFEEERSAGALDLGADVLQIGVLKTSGRAELLEEHHGKHLVLQDIRLHGQLTANLEMTCARCLESVVHPVEREFDLLYRPATVASKVPEVEVKGAESEISYYSGDGLDLNDALREQVLLALPLKVVCREDCKGLCPSCGCNRNTEACSCAAIADPRWEGLKDLQSKMQ